MLKRVISRVLLVALCGCLGVECLLLVNNSAHTANPQETDANIRVVPLMVNDLIYDRWNQTIYASIPSRGGISANSVVPLNPETGTLANAIPVGIDPRRMALSDDGQFLYVGLDGEGAIRRTNIASQSPELRFPLSNSAQL